MKTKNKVITSLKIAIVLCSLFLVALPTIAAEQTTQKAIASEVTTASEDDYVLDIYGNANEDDTIDMGDVVYTKLAIFGKKPKTELCDAKYDGRINVLDVIQTKLIILGKEKELTIVDDDERTVTVKKPIERIVVAYAHPYTLLQAIKATDKVVAGLTYSLELYPDFVDLPSIGTAWNIDFEALMKHQPDLVFIRPGKIDEYKKIKDLNPNIAVISIHCYQSWDATNYVEDTRQLGYLLDKEVEAEEFINYYERFMDMLEEVTSAIPEEDKLRVYYEGASFAGYPTYRTGGSGSSMDSLIVIAGGKNIFSDITESTVSAEDVIQRNPEVILKTAYGVDSGYFADDITGLRNVRDEIMNRPELQHVTAVKTGRVYVISSDIDCCGAKGGRYFLGVIYIAKCLHPNIDLDPTALHQEFITRFQGMDYDLYKHGVFVYHPEQFPEGR